MAEYVVMPKADYEAACDSIRAKTGKTDLIKSGELSTEIASITGGGGGSSADVRYVTFVNGATGEQFVKPVAYGDDCVDVVERGLWAEPTKESDAQYHYTFYDWGATDGGAADANILKNITEDKTVYAIFSKTLRTYTITYHDEDGVTVLHTEQVAYGTVPSYTPTKDGAAFVKWSPTPVAVTGDASYTASWTTALDSGTWGDNMTWILTRDGTLTISGTGEIAPCSSINRPPWYSTYKNKVTKIVIERGVTIIGTQAFWGLDKATGVTIADTVTSIGNNAFYDANFTTNVVIPNSVKKIGESAFRTYTGLTSVTFADPNGWWYATSEAATEGTAFSADDLSNPETAAKYLKSTYTYKYWFKS